MLLYKVCSMIIIHVNYISTLDASNKTLNDLNIPSLKDKPGLDEGF